MTEKEWLATPDMHAMLNCLLDLGESPLQNRKFRLVACACARHKWRLIDEPSRRAVEMAEAFADGRLSAPELAQAERDAEEARDTKTSRLVKMESDDPFKLWVAKKEAHAAYTAWASASYPEMSFLAVRLATTDMVHPALFRDIFGNPFHPVTFNPAWRTSSVTSLAAAVYDDRHLPSGLFDNQRLGVLADALEEAGCDKADILGHLRGGGEHVRGCWVLDLLLGKS